MHHPMNELRIQLTRIDERQSQVLPRPGPKTSREKYRVWVAGLVPIDCPVCKKVLQRKNLRVHMNTHSIERCELFPCRVCGRVFRHQILLERHGRQHEVANESLACTYCGKVLQSATSLADHVRTHTKERPHICSFCKAEFTAWGSLQKHLRAHVQEKPHKCGICDRPFLDDASFKRHTKTHRNQSERMQTCGICSASVMHLDLHMARCHTQSPAMICPLCPKTFSAVASLNRHVRSHTGEKSYKCQHCDKCFQNARYKKLHENIHTGVKPYVCKICGAKFTHNTSLVVHSWKHNDAEKPHKCDHCTAAYLFPKQLKWHRFKKHPEHSMDVDIKTYNCGFCEMTFKSQHYAEQHMRTHTGERPFPCPSPECVYRAKTKCALRNHHLQVHQSRVRSRRDSDRIHECTKCHMKFFELGHLKQHDLVHNSEKKIACQDCELKTKRKRQLEEHQLRMHSEEIPDHQRRPYHCTQCDMRYFRSDALRKHMQSKAHARAMQVQGKRVGSKSKVKGSSGAKNY